MTLMDCSLPSSSVHGISQARILEWVAISFSRGSFWPRDWTQVSCIVSRCFTVWVTREVQWPIFGSITNIRMPTGSLGWFVLWRLQFGSRLTLRREEIDWISYSVIQCARASQRTSMHTLKWAHEWWALAYFCFMRSYCEWKEHCTWRREFLVLAFLLASCDLI